LKDSPTLSKKLSELTFLDVFQRLDRPALESLWNRGRARNALESIVKDTSAEPRAGFLAAEILFQKVPGYPPETLRARLAEIYAAALANDYTVMANPWGLPGLPDGETAQHAVQIGETAVPALRRLLEDRRVVYYSGSKEATFGNRYRYRVKDLAAGLLARIRNLPFQPDEDPELRDQAIERLASML
jgi:hypothetical protein